MKIALVAPAERESAAARQCAELFRQLPNPDCQVELTTLRGSPAADGLALRRLLGRCGEVDLIHDHGGLFSQLAAARAGAPILVSLHAAPEGETREALVACDGGLHLVADSAAAAGGLDCFAVLPAGTAGSPALAGAYRAIYTRVIEAARKRRADTAHDKRPWGEYWVLADEPTYKVKRIDVLPGKRLSYQSHKQRAEHWTVVAGRARVTLDGRALELGVGESIDIPRGSKHRMENPGAELLTFVEVQHGSYFGEDDIVRYEDDFGRKA